MFDRFSLSLLLAARVQIVVSVLLPKLSAGTSITLLKVHVIFTSNYLTPCFLIYETNPENKKLYNPSNCKDFRISRIILLIYVDY